ncbi:ATP-binding cassette domain-containing protein [Candidatus Bathyarchaeota archaeon]|nr:MAG: ATP-binding cassette domain-containing protein [Candidatus Bathyarchaeota archaeon]
MSVVEINGLTKKFGDVLAVNNISFKVEKGEIFGFLGPNGAGKTTTLNILVTLMKPTKGTAKVAGYDVVRSPSKVREKIGVVFQDITLDRELTGKENLWIHGKVYKMDSVRLKKRMEELLAFTELEKWADVQVKKYSGGMMRRLEIARALVHNPEILFLDEPTLGLDPQTRVHVWDYIRKLREEKEVTVFLTTHYMDEAEKLCDRVAIIDNGKIISVGKPEDLTHLVGLEVVYVKIENNLKPENLLQISANSKFADDIKIMDDKTIRFSVKNASETIPKIFENFQRIGVKILEVKYHKPTLEDVFLHLTGKSLREGEATSLDQIRIYHMRRR